MSSSIRSFGSSSSRQSRNSSRNSRDNTKRSSAASFVRKVGISPFRRRSSGRNAASAAAAAALDDDDDDDENGGIIITSGGARVGGGGGSAKQYVPPPSLPPASFARGSQQQQRGGTYGASGQHSTSAAELSRAFAADLFVRDSIDDDEEGELSGAPIGRNNRSQAAPRISTDLRPPTGNQFLPQGMTPNTAAAVSGGDRDGMTNHDDSNMFVSWSPSSAGSLSTPGTSFGPTTTAAHSSIAAAVAAAESTASRAHASRMEVSGATSPSVSSGGGRGKRGVGSVSSGRRGTQPAVRTAASSASSRGLSSTTMETDETDTVGGGTSTFDDDGTYGTRNEDETSLDTYGEDDDTNSVNFIPVQHLRKGKGGGGQDTFRSHRGRKGRNRDGDDDDDHDRALSPTRHNRNRPPKRYRGFSTSISSLFLDEQVVCGACSCFGLLLSSRTEHLLNKRNERRGITSRGTKAGGQRTPSRILTWALAFTIALLATTYVIWGFGSSIDSGGLSDIQDGYDYDFDNGAYDYDDAAANNQDDDAVAADNQDDDAANNQQQQDDDAANNQQQQDDDANQQQNNGDDAVANDDAAANDDANNQGDDNVDDYNGDDAAAQGDDFYGDYDDAVNRRIMNQRKKASSSSSGGVMDDATTSNRAMVQHSFRGIVKIRDYHENVWCPLGDFFRDVMLSGSPDDPDATARVDGATTSVDGKPQQLKPRSPVSSAVVKKKDGKKPRGADINGPPSPPRQLEDGGGGGEEYHDDYYYYDETTREHDTGDTVRLILCFIFLCLLGVVGRRRRMRTRFAVLKARAQDDHLYFAAVEAEDRSVSGSMASPDGTYTAEDYRREDKYDGACSHTLCGCYPVDPELNDDSDDEYTFDGRTVTSGATATSRKKRKFDDCVSRAFGCVSATFCGTLCKLWIQCFSVCALAQEARETRLLVPPKLQRIDYVTHQPFADYQADINKLRRAYKDGTMTRNWAIMPHIRALSQLSRYILATFALLILVVIFTLVFNPRANFVWGDAVVLIATFLQSFLVLFVVFGIFHKSDLSFDAVIKFFTAGFVIAVPMAFFFEGVLVNVILAIVYFFYATAELFFGEPFVEWVVSNYQPLWIIGELINAYVVAAIIEELCKYYTFRTVEHPDLIFLTGLDRAAQDERAQYGGRVLYPYGSHMVSEFTRTNSFDSADSRGSQKSRGSHRSITSKGSRRSRGSRSSRRGHRGRSDAMIDRTDTENMEDVYSEDENDVRTYRQRAAAITTGMISVAVGLACAENVLYVFFLGGTMSSSGETSEEWVVLLFRSIFPVHAMAAAMQSIYVIRKFLEEKQENESHFGVGKIILPAVILHGTFDAILMSINVYIETSWDKYLEENQGNVGDEEPYNALLLNIVAWFSITFVMLAGALWYYVENRRQKARLKLMEEKEGMTAYVSPTPTAPKDQKDIELV